jgi:hypothetical protein
MRMSKMLITNRVEFNLNGGVDYSTYATIAGKTGVIARSSRSNWYASIGSQWEAAIEIEDEYCSTIAQSWYKSWEDAITSNLIEGEIEDQGFLSFSAELSQSELKKAYNDNFDLAGYTSPAGQPYFRPKKTAQNAVV